MILPKFYEKSIDANRNLIAILMITLTLLGIITITMVYMNGTDNRSESVEKIFNALLPLFATWIGTVLAYYFGKENFESASNQYKEIINKLSPDILDDISVAQIMITRKTMVSKDYEDLKDSKVVELITFLTEVDKSRLPILDGNKIMYIAHKSLLLDSKERTQNNNLSFQEFVKINKETLEGFLKVKETAILEDIREQMKLHPSIQDIFVLDDNENVIGWLTNTLIMDYLKTK